MNFNDYEHTCISDPRLSQWLGMENVLNQGSPSGFIANLPDGYGAGELTSGFDLPFVEVANADVTCYGDIPDVLKVGSNVQIPVHPLSWEGDLPTGTVHRYAIPTASLRTVYVPELECFVKLNFTGVIGRYTREYDLVKWVSAIENSGEILSLLSKKPEQFGFQLLDESHGMFVTSKKYGSFGVGIRKTNTTKSDVQAASVIPSFSLFCRREGRDTIASEIVKCLGATEENAFDSLIRPMIDTYFEAALGMGLFPEMNAQNVLVELDKNDMSVCVVLRDTGDFFKDITVRKRNGQHTHFVAYKTVEQGKVSDFYQRRSFAFDFKLGHYIILPLIDRFTEELSLDKTALLEMSKSHTASIAGTSEYFDSSEHWYRFPKIEGADRGDYVVVPKPELR